MNRQNLTNGAYILWLIRQSGAITWRGLCSALGMPPEERFTPFGMLTNSLASLLNAGLIVGNRPLEELFAPGDIDKNTFSVTPLVANLQRALQISLADLAATDTSRRLIVAPTINRTFSSRFESDILVLMPFLPDMRPIYDDHLKAVAKQTNMSIARADDFFTAGHIMEEIWTAILSAKIVVADCTGRNPNVFYEIGLAHAVGKPVILIAQHDEDVPFDLRYRRYLSYQFSPRGMKEFEITLAKVIVETIAERAPSPAIEYKETSQQA